MTDKISRYIDGVGWRYDAEHSMTRRMADHDYRSRCIYMLTLTLADRSKDALGSLSWLGNDKTPANAFFTPTALGNAVTEEWQRLEVEYQQIRVVRLQLMPEHLHVVLYVRERLEKPLGKYVGIVKNRCNKHYWQELTAKGLLGPKGEAKPPSLFSENFTDSILMHEGQLENMIRYVEHNPYRALVKRDNRELFRKVSRLVVHESDAARLQRDGSIDAAELHRTEPTQPPYAAPAQPHHAEPAQPHHAEPTQPHHAEPAQHRHTEPTQLHHAEPAQPRQAEPTQHRHTEPGGSGSKELGSFAISPPFSGTFAAIGNRWLLDRPMRMQVRCHNNTTPVNLQLIQRQKEYFLDRGRKGGVVVSPCISAGEKEIARAALDAGVPLIVILENGFPPMYKPPGKYFEACANGLLLMLAPWPHHTDKRTITRQQCLALNDMAYRISTEPWTKEMEERLL